jgi:hypothetical protein
MIGIHHPSKLSPAQRLEEIAHLLAVGFLRFRSAQSAPESQGHSVDVGAEEVGVNQQSSLEVSANQSPCVSRG